MGVSTIDIFPLFKQLPAVIGAAKPAREMLILVAGNYGVGEYDGKFHKSFERGVKEVS